MKPDLVALDAVRAERARGVARAPGRATTGLPWVAPARLVGASLAAIARGILVAALLFAWLLAEIVA